MQNLYSGVKMQRRWLVILSASISLFQNCSSTAPQSANVEDTEFSSVTAAPSTTQNTSNAQPQQSQVQTSTSESSSPLLKLPTGPTYYDARFDYVRCGGVAALFHPYYDQGQPLTDNDLILSAFGKYSLQVTGQGLQLPINPPANSDPRIYASGARVNYIFVDGKIRAMNSVYNSFTTDIIKPYLDQRKTVCVLTTDPSKSTRNISPWQTTDLYCPRKDSTGFGLEDATMMISIGFMSGARFPASSLSAANNIGAIQCYNGALEDSSLVTLGQFKSAFGDALNIVAR